MIIRKALSADHKRIMEIYRTAQDYMIQSGNPDQWGHFYPQSELIKKDIADGVCHILCDEDGIHAVFAMFTTPEPTYTYIEDGEWLNDEPYITIHRVASDGSRHGVIKGVIDYAKSLSENIRIDTHAQNTTMQHQLEKNGFKRCGIIYLESGAQRIAYHWTAKENNACQIN